MRKLLTFLGLVVGAGGLVLATASNHKAKESKAVDYETYIPMEAGFFTNWTDDAGVFADKNATFWGENYHFQAMDTFYRGELKEGWTGTLTSRTWKQHTQYIYFQLGGAKNYDVTGDPVHLKIHYGNLFDVFYNDTFVENPMLLRGYKIPDAAYNSLMENADDFDMYIEILDQQTAGYGFANFGYLHVNQTKEEVGDAMRYYLNSMDLNDRGWEIDKRKQILENYYLNDSLKEFFLAPVESGDGGINDGFDYVGEFLRHWYFDYHYFNGANWNLHFDKAIGYDTYRPDDATRMPFNNHGVGGFFRGWYENDELGGFVGGDNSIYRFISRPFVLGGVGTISIKMAGTASLHVIDAETRQDLVWADLLTFSTEGDQVNLANSNFNTVTMVRHVINLEAYLGRKIQLAIADVSDGGWSALYVDELRTNTLTYTSFDVDVFTQTNNSGTFYGYKLDKYINSTCYNAETNPTGLKYVLESEINKANDNAIINHVDNSPAKKAYDFLQQYYSSLRSPANEFDYSKASEETKANVVSAYNSLTSYVQGIVNWSYDIVYPTTFEQEWWKNKVSVEDKISDAFTPLVESYEKFTVSFNSNGGSGDMAPVNDVKGEYTLPSNGFTAPEGYQFVGWRVNGTGETLLPGEKINVSANTELVAQWELIPLNSYTVSFANNGGTGSMTSVAKEDGSTYALPVCTLTAPEGYEFAGWTVGSDETLRQPGYEITVTNDVVVTAQWSLIPPTMYSVSFDANGGSGSMSALEKEEGTSYTLPACGFTAPKGYEFAGWTVGSEETLRQPGYEFTVAGDVVITAQWSLIPVPTYTVSFDANGGSGEMASLIKEEGETLVLPANGFIAPEGYEFAGWKVGDEEGLKQPGYEVTVNGDLVIVAQWSLIPVPTYTVSFDANGGTGSMASLTKEQGETFVLPECEFVAPSGKQFKGWRVNGVGNLLQPGDLITVTGNVSLVAQWEVIPVTTFTVTFDANGGSGTMESLTLNKGEQLTLPECTFIAPEGKQFDSWLIGSVKYQPGVKITIAGDTLIKASWVNAEVEPTVDPEEPEKEEEEAPKGFFEKVLESFQDIFQKIGDFFKNLFAGFAK